MQELKEISETTTINDCVPSGWEVNKEAGLSIETGVTGSGVVRFGIQRKEERTLEYYIRECKFLKSEITSNHPMMSFTRLKTVGDLNFCECCEVMKAICNDLNGDFNVRPFFLGRNKDGVYKVFRIQGSPNPFSFDSIRKGEKAIAICGTEFLDKLYY